MIISPVRTRVFRESENFTEFVASYISKPKEKSVIVITSKIVALSEGRTAPAGERKDKDELIRSESEFVLKTKYTTLTIKGGTAMAAAGIDESNADGKYILLPKDSFKTAHALRSTLKKKFRLKHLGILITDSRTLPLRAGVTGVALGYAGFRGVKDYRGTKDIFGRTITMSRLDVADSLATAAVLTMGEGKEQTPIVVIQDAPVEFTERVKRDELHIDVRDDVYGPLFRKLK